MYGPQDPFSRISCRSQDLQLRHKSIHKTLIWKKNVTFPLQSKHFFRKYDNFQPQKFKFDCNFRQKAWKLCKVSVLKPLISTKIHSQAPTFMAIYIHSRTPKFGNPGRTYLPEKRLSAPPPPISTHWLLVQAIHTPVLNYDKQCRLVLWSLWSVVRNKVSVSQLIWQSTMCATLVNSSLHSIRKTKYTNGGTAPKTKNWACFVHYLEIVVFDYNDDILYEANCLRISETPVKF